MSLREKGKLKGGIKQNGIVPSKNNTSSNLKKNILRLGENSISFKKKKRRHRGESLENFGFLAYTRKEKRKMGNYTI